MGRLKGGANTEEEAERLTLGQLNRRIAHAEWRFANIGNSSLRKSAYKQLVWLEAQRERLHGVAAPVRRPRR
jgi:hypothetical protein